MLARNAAVSSLDFATARRSADVGTLHVLVDAIAEEVATKVKSEVAAHVQQLAGKVQPVLFNVKDAALYLGRPEQAVQHLIFEKALPVVRIGRRVHLDRRDLDAWIEKNKY
jgi:excisionase family DNA binding protein